MIFGLLPYSIESLLILTFTWSKSTTELYEYLPSYFCTDCSVNFIFGEPCISAVCSKKQNQLIIYTIILGLFMSQKDVFSAKNGALWWRTVKKRKTLFVIYFLNGFRNHKNFNRFKFQVLY